MVLAIGPEIWNPKKVLYARKAEFDACELNKIKKKKRFSSRLYRNDFNKAQAALLSEAFPLEDSRPNFEQAI